MASVKELLAGLARGTVTLDAVARDFARRDWPTLLPSPTDYRAAVARELRDPEPYPEGSWGEVMEAYAVGAITDEQYRALFEARARNGRESVRDT